MLKFNDLTDIALHLEDIKECLLNGGEVTLWKYRRLVSINDFKELETEITDFKNMIIEEYKKSVAPPERGTREKDKSILNDILKCKNDGLSDIDSINKLNIPRATYYRFKKILKEQNKL